MFNLKTLQSVFGATRPKQAERRLHNHALAYWNGLKDEDEFPLVGNFNFSKFESISSHGFLLDLMTYDEPTVTFMGDVLREEAGCSSAPIRVSEIAPGSLLGQFARRWEEVTTGRKPATSEYVFETFAGYRVSCRGVLLPLSTLGSTADCIFGVISWKSEKVSEDGQAFGSAPTASGG